MYSEYYFFLLGRLEEHYKISLVLQTSFKTLQAGRIFAKQSYQWSHSFICTPQPSSKRKWESGIIEAAVILNKEQ